MMSFSSTLAHNLYRQGMLNEEKTDDQEELQWHTDSHPVASREQDMFRYLRTQVALHYVEQHAVPSPLLRFFY